MPIDITMRRLSDQMEEATIIRWLKSVGDPVRKGDELAEIETDKATVAYEAEDAGVLAQILVGEGQVAGLGTVIGRLLVPGESIDDLAADTERGTAGAAVDPASPTAELVSAAPADGSRSSHRHRATPVARKTAGELAVDLSRVVGTGAGGRIVRADVRRAAAAAPATDKGVPIEVPLTPTQATIARRMAESKATIPHFTLTAEIDMTAAAALRDELRETADDEAPTLNDLIVKAVALALREFPSLNASFGDSGVLRFPRINVGIVVATDDALVVPTLFNADRLSLAEIARLTREIVARVRERTVSAAELSGGTFTISNLGMFGIRTFQAVIYPPQVAILAVGEINRRPVVQPDGIIARERMDITLSCDHRVVYGADGARFLARLRELLENPLPLIR
jgi:pyruvate dehydrogenase E2 component (dihydrolipoamide acetyltransferase)